MEEKNNKRGGKREGAGRPKRVASKKVLLYFENDLYEAFPKTINRNEYINNAVRKAMLKDGYISE